MPKRILLFLLCWGISPLFISLAEEKFPFLAEVTVDGVHVRSGQSTNFEALCRLKRGTQVVAVAKSYRWYKVRLPLEAKSYISQEYAQMLNADTALILKNRVNIRAGAGTQFTILGQLNKGTTVKVLETLEGWYRIEPVEGTYGWIADQFLTFKSDQLLPAPIVAQAGSGQAEMPKLSLDSTALAPSKIIQTPPSAAEPPLGSIASYTGRVENLKEAIPPAEIGHRLIREDGVVYYLQGPSRVMDEFVGYRVDIEGKILDDPQHLYPHPVIAVSKITLVL